MQQGDFTYEDYAVKVISSHVRLLNSLQQGVREGKDPEAIHQWRVTSRRLRDAIKVFKDLFPKEVRKSWDHHLRRFAQVAGQGRDLDIHIRFLKDFYASMKIPQHQSGIKKLFSIHLGKRRILQPRIRKALIQFGKSKTLVKMEHCLKDLSQRRAQQGNQKLFSVSQKRALIRLEKLLSLKEYVDQPRAIRGLHQMRIAAKHLRYTLETFEPLYGKNLKTYIHSVMSIQEVLGDVHDFDVWIETLPAFWSKEKQDENFDESLEFLRTQCQTLREGSYRKFVKIWRDCQKRKIWPRLTRLVSIPA